MVAAAGAATAGADTAATTGGCTTIGALTTFTGRRTSLPGCTLGARTVRRSPSADWNRGAKRM